MTSATYSVSLLGLEGHVIRVETHIGRGLVAFTLVGLPDASLRESKERVKAALQSCGQEVLDRKIIVNLSPAGIPKAGSGFDAAIALSVLVAAGRVNPARLDQAVVIAELGLDGTLRPVRGVLPALIAAGEDGFATAIVASANVAEAQLIPGLDVVGFDHLAELITWCGGEASRPSTIATETVTTSNFSSDGEGLSIANGSGQGEELDLKEVRGQEEAIVALEVGAAGGHHLHFIGEPGSGKTMLAQRLPTILPTLEDHTALTVTAIHSIAGTLRDDSGLMRRPPIQSPHHSVTMPALIGGGSGFIRPGAVSLAHGGVLFLDEAPEFSLLALDSLRQPLEQGTVHIHRATGSAEFPADFQLIMASNPCPCGGARRSRSCSCTSLARRRYQAKLSGPLRDRIDITVPMRSPTRRQLQQVSAVTSAQIRERVAQARERSQFRLRGTPWHLNRQVPGAWMRQNLALPESMTNKLDDALDHGYLTLRGCDRVLRVLWSIADLAGTDKPTMEHLLHALALRNGGHNEAT